MLLATPLWLTWTPVFRETSASAHGDVRLQQTPVTLTIYL